MFTIIVTPQRCYSVLNVGSIIGNNDYSLIRDKKIIDVSMSLKVGNVEPDFLSNLIEIFLTCCNCNFLITTILYIIFLNLIFYNFKIYYQLNNLIK